MATTTINVLLLLSSFLLCATPLAACCGCTLPSPPKPKPKPKPFPSPPIVPPIVPPPVPKPATCPIDTLKLGVCADVLGLVNVVVGSPPSGTPCCALLNGLVDLEAAVCLCTAIKANVLGIIQLDVPVALSLLLSACQKSIPPGFTC
ncbi:hypothetical protein Droror1_Dr00002755 [Drosera rotundifolia]